MLYLDELCKDCPEIRFEKRLFQSENSYIVINDKNAFLFFRPDMGLAVAEARRGYEDLVIKDLYVLHSTHILTSNNYLQNEFNTSYRQYMSVLFQTKPSYRMSLAQVREFVSRCCIVREPNMDDCRMILEVLDKFYTGIRTDELHELYVSHAIRVLTVHDTLIGFSVLSSEQVLRYVYVSPEYRGKSFGVYLSRVTAESCNCSSMYAFCPVTDSNCIFVFLAAGYEMVSSDLVLLSKNC